MKKIKWFGVLYAVFVVFMYVMGIYDLFMMLGNNRAYYVAHGYGQNVMNYFTDYPIGLLVLWIVNLVCGVLSPILYAFKKKGCVKIAFLSFSADTLLIAITCIFRNRIGVLGWNIFLFDLFILLMTFGFGILCRQTWKSNER